MRHPRIVGYRGLIRPQLPTAEQAAAEKQKMGVGQKGPAPVQVRGTRTAL